MRLRSAGPHGGQPVAQAGVSLEQAQSAMVLVHGRGDSAAGILQLAGVLPVPGMAYLAPQASGQTWYPNRFLRRSPPMSRGSRPRSRVWPTCWRRSKLPASRPTCTVLLGFSQGGCLALKFAVRNPRRYGALAGLSGGLIGPPGRYGRTPVRSTGRPRSWDVATSIPTSPRLGWRNPLACCASIGGDVTAVLYPGMDHTVTEEELEQVRRIIAPLGADVSRPR